MLSEMALRRGSRVLEIGTGSGYNAALLAELVGDPALVTTVDIDPALTAEAIPRLDRLGYGGITVSCGDGATGVPDRAPFDRVVATVGCVDVSPAWVDQLADGGGLLAPLEHGPMHPRVAVRRSDAGLVGRFTGRSGFVRIQGSQASYRVWADAAPAAVDYRVERLPTVLAEAFDPPIPGSPHRMSGLWDFATYLGIRDRRAVSGPGLCADSSAAMIRGDTMAIAGPGGGVLAERLLAVGRSWVELGCPGHDRYAMTFTAKDAGPVPPDTPGGPWVLDRIDYRQHVTLSPQSRALGM
jgi:protein-L-isoaspartate(D-aspartate) O-methyltransferase